MTLTPSFLSPNSKTSKFKNTEKMTSTPSLLSPNSTTSKFKNTNNVTPISISKNSSQNHEGYDEDLINHGATVEDEITEIEYLQRKIVIQNLEMKRMQRKSNELEEALIT